ncbi:Tetratricopeptide repeat-containing protein [Duganella sp. CF458]|uniref:tetratricopeptide repeat protein n=1 Tax=Duganella sp. CF458 TaxID=1884368 RepID=UPI0008EE1418|nr:tetratricopeptide repeat protein [Duganella sp. CF458]SFG88397.1 Tetratricopeptide repeat-containing protein [Duganella sp. CF458]
MNNPVLSILDQTELMQLALEADRNNDSGSALAYLKEAGGRPDASAPVLLLLGAHYASLQLHERAIQALEMALVADPQLAIARFQLGMLYLSTGNGARAAETMQPLEDLDHDNALHHFGRGLRSLVKDELSAALEHLQRGITLNKDNPALNADMQHIIDEINKAPAGQTPAAAAPAPADSGDSQHVMLSAYTGLNVRH